MTAVVIAVRWVWTYTMPYVIRLLDRRPAQRLRRVGARQRTVSAVAGFRGAVSLAAVLAVPHTLDSGAPFPDRDLIVLITCGVIVLTLLQALLLPAVVRFARLPVDTSVSEELQLAEVFTLDSAIEAARRHRRGARHRREVVERVRHELDKQRKLLAAAGADGDPVVRHDDQYTSLSLALIAAGARRSSSCATSNRSTTSCCAGSRPGSTSKRCGSPARTPSNEPRARQACFVALMV